MLGGFQATHVALFRPLCDQLQRGSARRKVMTSSSPFNQVVSVFVPDEGTRSLLMRLHESELAMVEKDKAMVEKDKAMVEKEVKHVQVEIELRLTIAEREKQLELGAMQTRLEDAKTELAKEKGLLNCRGMIELIEEEMRKVCLWKTLTLKLYSSDSISSSSPPTSPSSELAVTLLEYLIIKNWAMHTNMRVLGLERLAASISKISFEAIHSSLLLCP